MSHSLRQKLFGCSCNGYRVSADDAHAPERIASALHPLLQKHASVPGRILTVCIGTDRSTGDSLGPLVGYHLKRLNPPGVAVLGTLDSPVHATNLAETIERIEMAYTGYTVLAVDACLGRLENIGTISIMPGPIHPGAGVHKNLPPLGQIAITGTVNLSGVMEYLVLQNTRLSLVMRMAEVIARGISLAATGRCASAAAITEGHNHSSSSGIFHGHTHQASPAEGNSEAAPGICAEPPL